jgi:hypothetical protein
MNTVKEVIHLIFDDVTTSGSTASHHLRSSPRVPWLEYWL